MWDDDGRDACPTKRECGCVKAFHLLLPLKCFEPVMNIVQTVTYSKSLL